jgi:hypothetical protein
MLGPEIIGNVYGRLTVLGVSEKRDRNSIWYRCACSCKNHPIIEVTKSALVNHNTQSCGCLRNEKNWERINSQAKQYTYDGVTLNLRAWSERLGIDLDTLRSRLDKGWTVEQALTRTVYAHHPRRVYEYEGKFKTINQWEQQFGLASNILYYHIVRRGKTVAEALAWIKSRDEHRNRFGEGSKTKQPLALPGADLASLTQAINRLCDLMQRQEKQEQPTSKPIYIHSGYLDDVPTNEHIPTGSRRE